MVTWLAFKGLVMLYNCEHDIKVTKIGKGWNIRCFRNEVIVEEIRVFAKVDIGVAIKEALRWEDKMGAISKMATESRERLNSKPHQGYSKTPQRIKV